MRQKNQEIDLELSRIEEVYRQRALNNVYFNLYSCFNEAAILQGQSLDRNLLALLKRHGFTDLANKKLLDVGCGNGVHLRRFLEYGSLPDNLSGIDLIEQQIETAKYLQPRMDWPVGSAHQLPYQDSSFDLVMSLVMFSSILSESLRQSVADEMWRVCKPDGLILFYDFTYSNPHNPAVQGIPYGEIQQHFIRPGAKFDFRRVTLAPPIARVMAPQAYWLANILEQFKLLNTHIIGVISLD